jgi:hypothetical protein
MTLLRCLNILLFAISSSWILLCIWLEKYPKNRKEFMRNYWKRIFQTMSSTENSLTLVKIEVTEGGLVSPNSKRSALDLSRCKKLKNPKI